MGILVSRAKRSALIDYESEMLAASLAEVATLGKSSSGKTNSVPGS